MHLTFTPCQKNEVRQFRRASTSSSTIPLYASRTRAGQASSKWSLLPSLPSFLPFLLSFFPSSHSLLSLLRLDLPLLLRLHLLFFFHPTHPHRILSAVGHASSEHQGEHSAPALTACPSEYTFLSSLRSSSSLTLLLSPRLSVFLGCFSNSGPLHRPPPTSISYPRQAIVILSSLPVTPCWPCRPSPAPLVRSHRHVNVPNPNSCPSVSFSFGIICILFNPFCTTPYLPAIFALHLSLIHHLFHHFFLNYFPFPYFFGLMQNHIFTIEKRWNTLLETALRVELA